MDEAKKAMQAPLMIWAYRWRYPVVYLGEQAEIMRLAFRIPTTVTEMVKV